MSADLSAVTRGALSRLLALVESAVARGDERASRLNLMNYEPYLSLPSHADKARVNGELLLVERAGGIHIEWDGRAGERSQATRLQVKDRDALASFLGVVPRWAHVMDAESAFKSILAAYPALEGVLAGWRRGVHVRGTRPGDVRAWLDAAQVISHCLTMDGQDISVRRLSTSLARDSKRIESLCPVIDALLLGDPSAPARSEEEVFAEIGLVKHPPTWLVAGELEVLALDGAVRLVRPYLGFPPGAITGFQTGDVGCVLTIENQTTFHEMAASRPAGTVCVYTGGMPSPSWRRVYTLLLSAVPTHAEIFHWGDIDAGGFRIADHIARTAATQNRRLRLHAMVAPEEATAGDARKQLSSGEISQITRICHAWGWSEEASAVAVRPFAIEQEGLPAQFPR